MHCSRSLVSQKLGIARASSQTTRWMPRLSMFGLRFGGFYRPIARPPSHVCNADVQNGGSPSWAPDWSVKRPANCLGRAQPYRGHGTLPLDAIVLPEDGIVSIMGELFDDIKDVVPSPSFKSSSVVEEYYKTLSKRGSPLLVQQQSDCIYHWVEQCRNLAALTLNQPKPGKTSTREEAFWRTLIANMKVGGGIADEGMGAWFEGWMDYLCFWHNRQCAQEEVSVAFDDSLLEQFDLHQAIKAQQYSMAVCQWASGRSFAATSHSRLALVPKVAAAGDQLHVLPGGLKPFVLRPYGSGFRVLGEAYVHGIMHGEVLGADVFSGARISLV